VATTPLAEIPPRCRLRLLRLGPTGLDLLVGPPALRLLSLPPQLPSP
jgi:hypothetical protein